MTIITIPGVPRLWMVASGHQEGDAPNSWHPNPLCLYHHDNMEVYFCFGLHDFRHVNNILRNRVGAVRKAFAVEMAGMERRAGWAPGLNASSSTRCLQCLTALLLLLWILKWFSCLRAFAQAVLPCPSQTLFSVKSSSLKP